MIRLYWWRPGKGKANFGDELSRYLCERLSWRWTEWTPLAEADMISIGSLLAAHLFRDSSLEQFSGLVWGSGCMLEGERIRLTSARIHALRGLLTLNQVEAPHRSSIVVGDPALLAHLLITREPAERFGLGIMPHWSEIDHPFYRFLAQGNNTIKFITPLDDVDTVLSQIQSCQCLLSSSLHGLIAADALGIPNRWLRLNTGHENQAGATLFKFRACLQIQFSVLARRRDMFAIMLI